MQETSVVLTLNFSEVNASVPTELNKLDDWVRDFSPWASSAMGAQQKRNLAQG